MHRLAAREEQQHSETLTILICMPKSQIQILVGIEDEVIPSQPNSFPTIIVDSPVL